MRPFEMAVAKAGVVTGWPIEHRLPKPWRATDAVAWISEERPKRARGRDLTAVDFEEAWRGESAPAEFAGHVKFERSRGAGDALGAVFVSEFGATAIDDAYVPLLNGLDVEMVSLSEWNGSENHPPCLIAGKCDGQIRVYVSPIRWGCWL